MSAVPAAVAVRRLQQLTEESPYNRSNRPSLPQCQRLALETGFGNHAEVFARIRASEEWRLSEHENIAMAPEQFKAFAETYGREVG